MQELLRRCHANGDSAAREAIVIEFMPLARKLARRYIRSSEPHEDLVQVASLGLVKAIDGFDPGRGPSFAAFAIPTILGELRRYFRDATWSLHVPRGTQERVRAIDMAVERHLAEHGSAPTVEQLAVELELGSEEVLEALLARRAYETEPYDAPHAKDEEGLSVAEAVGSDDESYELVEQQAAVLPALRLLSERERRVLRLRFFGELSQKEIAAQIGVSQMQVSRILAATLERVRQLSGTATAA